MTRPTAMVAGAGGFIGRHVSDALRADGYDVIEVGRGTAHAHLAADRLPAAVAGVSLAVFAAGASSVGQSLEAPLADFAKSVPPLVEILELLRTRAPAARLVLLSSAAVYGQTERSPIDEDTPLRPISPYGVHKQVSEQLCASWAKSFGLHAVIVRLFSVYGPGLRKQLLWDACTKARAGDRRFAGTGGEVRDWLHVSDAAALVLAAARAASPEVPILNGGSGTAATVAEVVGEIFEALGGGARPEFAGSGRPGDPSRYLADIRRATALGWRPRVELREGVQQYVKWFLEQG